MKIITSLCLACQKPVKGRSDKKFCDDYCRNAYNNELKSKTDGYVKHINQVLKKNRSVLEELLGREEMKKQPKNKLSDKGFRFDFHTHQYTNKKGNTYYFCYEYGYLALESEWYLIVKRNEEKKVDG